LNSFLAAYGYSNNKIVSIRSSSIYPLLARSIEQRLGYASLNSSCISPSGASIDVSDRSSDLYAA
jgi:hypothetical protein